MKTKNYISIGVVSLLLLAGCATTFRPWKMDQVQKGMSKKQVEHLLGKPTSVKTKDGVEYLYYTYSEDYNPASAAALPRDSDTPEMKWEAEQIRASIKKQTYVVKMADGKVLEHKEITKK